MKTVVVTGGTRGVGLGIAKSLARHSYHVIAIGRQPTDELSALMGWSDLKVHYLKWDLSDLGMIPDLAMAIRDLADGTIYGLVNNVGMSVSGVLSLTKPASIKAGFDLNVLCPILLTRSLIGSMMAAKKGRIINISSIVATTGYPGLSVYSATKAAIEGFTRSLAREVGPRNITVNAVAPGFLDTEMTHELTDRQRDQIVRRSALHSMATIDDVAATVQFLMSEGAAKITGTTITVDAGNTV